MAEGISPAEPGSSDYLRGKADAYQSAPVTLEANYTIPIEVHNPMELHGILAHWTGADTLMIYAKTQGVNATQNAMAQAFKIDPKNIHVHTEFMGGGFGMGLRTWPQETAVVAIARKIGRPLKLVVTRDSDVYAGWPPALYGADHQYGGRQERQTDRNCSRGNGRNGQLRRLYGSNRQHDQVHVRMPEREHPLPPCAARPERTHLDARPGRSNGSLCARIGDGRDGP